MVPGRGSGQEDGSGGSFYSSFLHISIRFANALYITMCPCKFFNWKEGLGSNEEGARGEGGSPPFRVRSQLDIRGGGGVTMGAVQRSSSSGGGPKAGACRTRGRGGGVVATDMERNRRKS